MKIGWKKLVSLMLCTVMLIHMLPTSALAEDAIIQPTVAVAETPATEAPATEAPATEAPVAEEPAAEEPVAEEPAAEEPVAEEPAAEEPAAEEPAAEEPVTEEPVAEEITTETPVSDEIAIGEEILQEPSAGETTPEAETAPDEETTKEAAPVIVSGKILWVGREKQEEADRPGSVTLTLYADGAAGETITVSAPSPEADEWSFSFGEKPAQNDQGNAIVYTVEQSDVPGYTTRISGLTVTNTYLVPEAQPEISDEVRVQPQLMAVEGADTTTTISGNVIWVNRDQQDRNDRPASVTLTLYANGVATDRVIELTGNGTTWPFSFTNVPTLDADGRAIEYTVVESDVSGYEITYSFDTLTITNSYLGGDSWENHSFSHIDVRISGASLEIQHVLKDANGVVISRRAETIVANVTNVDYVTLDGKTYTGFEKSGTYEFRKMNLRIDLTENSTVTMQVDLVDSEGNVYNNVTITYGMGGIMDAAYECDGYRNGRFDGLDFIVGAAQNYVIEFVSYGVGINVQKKIQAGSTITDFSGVGGEFSFLLTEVETGRTWTVTNDADGTAAFGITYPYSTEEELLAYDGKTYTYTLQEVNGSSQYTNDATVHTFTVTLSVEKTATNTTLRPLVNGQGSVSFSFTNTMETVSVSGGKTWVDGGNRDGKRPASITIHLLADGEVVDTITVTAEEGWQWSFTDLPKYNSSHEEIVYTVSEEPVPDYETVCSGMNVTNTYVPATVEISGTKTWVDGDNQDGFRPEFITIRLYADGVEIDSRTVTGDDWSWNFGELPKHRDGGVEIQYTIAEDAVGGYTTAISGYNVTNTHTPETIDISGGKTWDDANNQDGLRPEFITIHLVADGEVIETVTVTGENEWKWSFEDLPKFADGVEIDYTITEDPVAGYTAVPNGYNLTNTHVPATVEISGTKTWADADNQDGLRPEAITIRLYADGVELDSRTVTGDNWSWSFGALPKYRNGGVEIVYTIAEDPVTGYASEVSGYNVTNTHTPETIDISGGKTWKDAGNQDGLRPESITIHLLADGEVIETVTVTAEDWSWSFNDLPKYRDGGVEIQYTITEDPVDGYTAEPDGYNLTNTHIPATVEISGTKTWADADNQDGLRPESIIIRLSADGEEIASQTVSGDNWSWNFGELPKYRDGGVEIVYTIAEDEVDGYTTEVSGYNVTNTHTPETIHIAGTKTWEDAGNQDGLRPESITIHLLADGVEIDSRTVTGDDWSWDFGELPKYRDGGVEIVYAIAELSVENYSTSYDGYNVINKHTPQQTSITVTKAWDDADNQDGLRPASVTIALLADGEETGETLVLSAENNWTGSFTELDKFRPEGVAIEYTIREVPVENYTVTITGDVTAGFTVTNTHETQLTSVSGTKIWDDSDNQDGIRPESITVRLHADGVEIASQTVTGDDWNWSFDNLPKYRDGGVEIEYTITEDEVDGYTTAISGYNVTNTHTPETITIAGNKIWDDANDQDGIRPESITIHLLADGVEIDSVTVTGDDWNWSFNNLPKYRNGGVEIVYTLEEEAVAGYTAQMMGNNLLNTHVPETISIQGVKTWYDADNQDGLRPGSITIRLAADGEEIASQTVTGDDWSWSFDNLPKYRDGGVEIVYTITEDPVEGYTSQTDGYNVSNTHSPEKMRLSGSKVWSDADNQDGIRPDSITVHLLADGVVVASKTVTAADNWSWTFVELDVYSGGKEIVYTVEEAPVEGYTAVVTGSAAEGFVITNTHVPETIGISGIKTWADADNQDGIRPESITIRLCADGEEIASQTVTGDDWSWSFDNLPRYRDGGEEIVYTITEDAVAGYTAEVTGHNVTNTHTPEQLDIPVTKVWNDADNQDGIRANDIIVILLANGAETGQMLVLSQGNDWSDSFTDLPKYAGGVEIVYTIAEVAVAGYTTAITGSTADGYTITNTHEPEVISVEGSKTWEDADNQDGLRPESITIRLSADGEEIASQTVTGEDWSWSFDNLPKYRDGGVEIEYTITEDAVENYSTTYEGYNITNKYTPQQISITVTKAWDDADNQDGLRPASVTVHLLADGEETGKTLVLSAENNWTGSFTELDKYRPEGQEIVYTIEEVAVTGYTTAIAGDAAGGFRLTNTHVPETIDISGTKTWDDADNQDGKRPEAITIHLVADGEVVQTVTVTAAEDWKWSFADLPKYSEGVEIVYAVTEDTVEGYTTTYDGYNVTNKYAPEKISITVVKAWADSKNADGKRPDKVTIILLADGQDTGRRLVLSADNGWVGSFTDLPKYAGGKLIEYTIDEVKVSGYNTVIRGSAEAGFSVTNSRTDIPTTGDERLPMVWIGLMMASVLSFAAAVVPSGKKRRR